MTPQIQRAISSTETFSFQKYKEVFLRSISQELKYRVTEAEKQDVVRFILSIATEHKLHTVFTSAGIKAVSDTVFLNPSVRDFVLSLSDRFFIETASDEEDNQSLESLIKIISNGLNFYSVLGLTSQQGGVVCCKIPDILRDHLAINSLKTLLTFNNWLIVVVMILLTYPELNSEIDRSIPAA